MRLLIGLCLWTASVLAAADEIALNPAHPDRYTVVHGDTLWDIAGRFLQNPWQWPEIWHNNPAIENPHLIYPGDVLVFSRGVDGKPRIQVESPSDVRLSPQVRISPLELAIPTIPMDAIRQFLTRPRVLTEDSLLDAPYVVDFAEEHIVGGAGNRIYVRAIEQDTGNAYTVFRAGPPYKDAESGEILGYEALYVADTSLERVGDPATLLLTRTEREVRIGDRLLPIEQQKIVTAFHPHAPKLPIRGHIIGVLNGVYEIGQYNVVVIDRGTADGIESGHVLDIYQQGRVTRDIVSRQVGESIRLPNELAGALMIFRPFERVSYALVMTAKRALHLSDIVSTP